MTLNYLSKYFKNRLNNSIYLVTHHFEFIAYFQLVIFALTLIYCSPPPRSGPAQQSLKQSYLTLRVREGQREDWVCCL